MCNMLNLEAEKPHRVPLLSAKTGTWSYSGHTLTKTGQLKIRKTSPSLTNCVFWCNWQMEVSEFSMNFWDVAEQEICSMNVQQTNLIATWTRISKECFLHLVESMPRIQAVLGAKGALPNTRRVYLIKWPLSTFAICNQCGLQSVMKSNYMYWIKCRWLDSS